MARWRPGDHDFENVLAKQERKLVRDIMDAIKQKAAKGHVDAVDWLASRGEEIGSEILDAIAQQAAQGDLRAAAWLEDRGLVDLPGKKRQ